MQLNVTQGCEGCVALEAAVRRAPCVRKVVRTAATGVACHTTVTLVAPHACGVRRAGEMIGQLTMPRTVRESCFFAELRKDFQLKNPVRPLPHQAAYATQFNETAWPKLPPGILLSFSLGSGKTHASLHLAETRGATLVHVVCAVSLIGQWQEAIESRAPPSQTSPTLEYRIYGYAHFEKLVSEKEEEGWRDVKGSMVIVDEAHYYKNMKDGHINSILAFESASCCQLLTGTPIRNDVRDFDFVLRMLHLSKLIPPLLPTETVDSVEKDYTRAPNPYASRAVRQGLLKGLTGRVALYDPRYCEAPQTVEKHYPKIIESVVEHELTWPQVLCLFLQCDGVVVQVKPGVKVNGGGRYIKSRLSVMNSIGEDDYLSSSKADAVVQGIERIGRYPQVIYSAFDDGLLTPLSERIAARFQVRVRILTGKTPSKDRKPLLDSYNRGDVDVLLICKVGCEGLDLFFPTVALHLMEPQTNTPEESQIIGRVRRYTKEARPNGVEPIAVVRYKGIFPQTPPDKRARRDLVDAVRDIPKYVKAFTGSPLDATSLESEIVTFLTRRIAEKKLTDEQRMSKNNIVKYKRTNPLEILLWMASGTVQTPNEFRNTWADMMGERRPVPLPEPVPLIEPLTKMEVTELRAKVKIEQTAARLAETNAKIKRRMAREAASVQRISDKLLRRKLMEHKRLEMTAKKAREAEAKLRRLQQRTAKAIFKQQEHDAKLLRRAAAAAVTTKKKKKTKTKAPKAQPRRSPV